MVGWRMLTAAGVLACTACGSRAGSVTPVGFALPESTWVVDGGTGAPLETVYLLRRVGEADIVLLGEVHDNPWAMDARARLLTAFGARRPAVVFEQFAAADSAIARPAPGDSLEGWLDRVGFDRRGWRWPMHRPVVSAAITHGRSLWGSNISREDLRSVVRGGESAAPDPLRRIMERTPLDSSARAALDRDLVEGHCGQLPESQIPGMRAAQVVRDAAMVRAINMARAGTGPVWLIAGNGHVRKGVAVPRLLDVEARDARVLVIGLLERTSAGAEPAAAERRLYDLVIVTPRAQREDPCRQFTAPR